MSAERTTRAVLCAFVLSALFFSGCATMSDVVGAREHGMAVIYPVAAARAWEIAKTVLREEGAEAIEEHQSQGYMLSGTGVNMVTAGSLIGVWIEPVDENHTRVTVVTKRRFVIDPASGLREKTFQERFGRKIESTR